jgi:hypothetical protein
MPPFIGFKRAFAVLLVAVSAGSVTAHAQTVTSIPLSALSAYSWGSSTVTQDPAGYPSGSALVQSTGGGWQWAGGMSFSSSSNPDVYNALKQAALTSGSITVRATFSTAFLSGDPVQYLGITTNQNTGTSGWVQTNVGFASTPITTPQTLDFSLPIVASSSLVQPADFSSNFYVDPTASTISFGFGVNTNSATVGGYVFESMSVSAVPEPGTYALLAGSVIAGLGATSCRRLRPGKFRRGK